MSYTLYIYDCDRCGGEARYSEMRGKNAIAEVMEKLDRIRACEQRRGPSVVFERLALRLLQRFPLPQEVALWQDGDLLETVHQLEDGLWTLEIAAERADELLAVLLPLARFLHLTVLDPQRGLLVQYQQFYIDGFVFPPSALADYQRLDPEAATAQFTKAKLRRYLLEYLTPRLAEHGFQYKTHRSYSVNFQRQIDGKEQKICGCIEGSSPDDYRGEFEIVDPDLHSGIKSSILREIVQPNWDNEIHRTEFMRNFEEAEWLAEDLLKYGLPILDKARTLEGVDWLYNSPEAASVFFGNVYHSNPFWRHILAIKAATQVRNPHFEEIAIRLLEKFADKPDSLQAIGNKKLIDQCRAQLHSADTESR
jgi:hypothetical protein